MKKFISAFLSLVLIISLALPSFAEGSTYSEVTSPLFSCPADVVKLKNKGLSSSKFNNFSSGSVKPYSESFDYCCRNFLNDTQKILYDSIVNSEFGTLTVCCDCNFTYDEFITFEEFVDISYAISYDHPELFYFEGFNFDASWVDDGNGYFDSDEVITRVVFYLSPYIGEFTQTSIPVYNEAINTAISSGKAVFDACTSRAELIKSFHDFICEKAVFDDVYSAALEKGTTDYLNVKGCAAGVFTGGGLCVCQAYAETFKLLCNMYHIPCLTPVSYDHMWNAVELDDGKWYVVDVTWDDQKGIDDYILRSPKDTCDGSVFESTHVLYSDDIITKMNLPYADVGFDFENYVDTRFKMMKNVTEITDEKILIRSVSDLGDDIYYNGLYRATDGSMGFTAPSGEDRAFENWKYLYLGDANLNEEFEIQDYSLIVNNSLNETTPETPLHFWANDVNMDGVLDVIDVSICELALAGGYYIKVIPVEAD